MSSLVSQPRHLALLCYLALARPRGLHSRDTIIALLWPRADERSGRRALRNALYTLRQRLGDGAIVSIGNQLIGLNDALVSCDAHDLEKGTGFSRWMGTEPPEPLLGLHVRGSAPFEEWMDRERRRLRGLISAGARTEPSVPPNPTGDAPRSLHALSASGMYARGHYLFLRSAHGGSSDELLSCREYFERALRVDPDFAPALAGLANFYAVAARRSLLTPFHETFERAIDLSRQAIERDPTLAVPHVHFAVKALYLDDDWEEAGREFALAATLEPDYAEGRRFYGVWLGLVGRHQEALAEIEAAAALEPDIPHMLSSLGAARFAVGDLAGAEDALRATLHLDARHPPARERLLRVLEDTGRYSEAVAERTRSPAMPGGEHFLHAFQERGAEGYLECLRSGLRTDAEAIESRLTGPGDATPNDIFSPPQLRLAQLYARLGDRKRVRALRLWAMAERPALAKWFASVPELSGMAAAEVRQEGAQDPRLDPRQPAARG